MALDYFNNLVPSHRELAVVMVGLAPEHALFVGGLTAFSPKASFVGDSVAHLSEMAKL